MKTIQELLKLELSHKHYRPLFARRLIMLAFIFGVNMLFAVYLFVFDPLNANMSVLSILVLNLIAYFAYYVINKVRFIS
jgi:VIT1/CCC1 family predicted Fe2+/Mn2+ transporter